MFQYPLYPHFVQPRSTGEPKTKPTQSSVRELRGLGLSPDLIVCRSEKPIGQSVRDKVSNFCHVGPEQVCTNKLELKMKESGIFSHCHGFAGDLHP